MDNYIGTFSQDTLNIDDMPPGSYAIINVDTSNEPGSHWVGVTRQGYRNNTGVKGGRRPPDMMGIYDSFGRQTKTLLPLLYEQIKKKGYELLESHKVDQSATSNVCGLMSLAWLRVVSILGLDEALTL